MQNNSDTEEIQVDLNKLFDVKLTGRHIQLLLQIINNATFQGTNAFAIAEMINNLQAPLIADARRIQAAQQKTLALNENTTVAAEPVAAQSGV